jgi:predicted nucleotidyltransferase
MIRLVEEHRKNIINLCIKYHVRYLALFGSAIAESHFVEVTSDLDFLVEFQPLEQGQYADTYFGLLESLEELFQRPVDLLMVRAIKNRYFLEAINQNRELLYAA